MDGSITTNKGIALIGKLLAQKGALQITRVAVGDGTPPASPATLNALVHELKNATRTARRKSSSPFPASA